MRHRAHGLWDNAIKAVIDARNHSPRLHIQREIFGKLTRRLQEEGLSNQGQPETQQNTTCPTIEFSSVPQSPGR